MTIREKLALFVAERRQEKQAFDVGRAVSAGGQAGLYSALPGAIIGGLMARKKPWNHIAHDALLQGIIGGVPSFLYGVYGDYQQQNAEEEWRKQQQQAEAEWRKRYGG